MMVSITESSNFKSRGNYESSIWDLLYSKTLLEELNVLVWATLDFTWMRADDSKVLIGLGILALTLQCFQFSCDVRKCFLIFNSGRFSTNDALENLFLSLAMIFWLISNIIWGYGECESLNNSAIFNNFYNKETRKAEKILCISILFVISYATLAVLRTFKGKTARSVKSRDGFVKMSATDDNACLNTNSIRTPLIKSLVRPSVDSPNKDNLKVTKQPVLVKDTRDRDRYVKAHCIATTLENPIRSSNRNRTYYYEHRIDKQILDKEVSDFWRHIEEMFLMFWILKDFSWMHEWIILWSISAGLIICVSIYFVWNVLNSSNIQDPVYKCGSLTILLTIWSLSNVVWAGGEMFFTDNVIGIPSGDARLDLAKLIPDLFALPHLTPCWTCRWLASWIVLCGIIGTSCMIVKRMVYNREHYNYS